MGEHLQERLRTLEGHPLVGEVRGLGLIAAVELVTDKAAKTALEMPGQLGGLVNAELQNAGVISRNMGDALAFCPPLIIQRHEIDEIVSCLSRILDGMVPTLRQAA